MTTTGDRIRRSTSALAPSFKALLSLGVKATQAVLGVAVAAVMARALGADGYGRYAYAVALVTLLAVPARFGLPILVVREVAAGRAAGAWGLVRGIQRWTTAIALSVSFLLVLLAVWLLPFLRGQIDALHLPTLYWGCALIPLFALSSIRAGALRGLDHVIQGQVPDQVLRPLLLATAVLVVSTKTDGFLTAERAMVLHVAATMLAYWVGALLLLRARPEPLRQARPQYSNRAWAKSAFPLALLTGFQLINSQADVLMIGLFRDAADVGVYRVASQGALMVSFAISAVNMVTAPKLAQLWAAEEFRETQRVVTRAAREMFAVGLPLGVVLIVFGGPILRHVFGASFEGGASAMSVLVAGQLVHCVTGPLGYLLAMSHHERDAALGVGVAAVANVALNALLIPRHGLVGAALATTVTHTFWNVLLWAAARRRLGIDGSALGRLVARRTERP